MGSNRSLSIATAGIALILMSTGRSNGQESGSAIRREAARATYETPDSARERANSAHPLAPLLNLALQARESLEENVRDYRCKILRRERVSGNLGRYEAIQAKIRRSHEVDGEEKPRSIYLKFLYPPTVEGREVLYVDGKFGGKMLVRKGGRRLPYVTTFLDPNSPLAMKENRHPVTEVGFAALIDRMVEMIRSDLEYDEVEVRQFKDAVVEGRPCRRIQVTHPVERSHFSFHRADVFLDEEHLLPIGYASYTWPDNSGADPVLVEEYYFTDLEINAGLTDDDFSRDNPDYLFLKSSEASAGQ